MMFKILVIQAQNNLSDERAEFLINDRLSFTNPPVCPRIQFAARVDRKSRRPAGAQARIKRRHLFSEQPSPAANVNFRPAGPSMAQPPLDWPMCCRVEKQARVSCDPAPQGRMVGVIATTPRPFCPQGRRRTCRVAEAVETRTPLRGCTCPAPRPVTQQLSGPSRLIEGPSGRPSGHVQSLLLSYAFTQPATTEDTMRIALSKYFVIDTSCIANT